MKQIKRKVLAALLATCLMAALLPAGALAAGEGYDHNHPVCGAECDHDADHTDVSWTAWDPTDPNQKPTTAGYYYFTDDLIASPDGDTEGISWLVPDGASYLCLNGHSVAQLRKSITISTGSTLTICDCQGGGSVGGWNTGTDHGTIEVINGGTLNLYSGTIHANGELQGARCAIYVAGASSVQSKVNLYGGTVQAQNPATNVGTGYAVYLAKFAEVYIYGGSFSASDKGHYSCALFSDSVYCTATVTGGSFTGDGPAAMVGGYNGGTLNISGGTFTSTHDSAVNIQTKGTGNISGGVFIGAPEKDAVYVAGRSSTPPANATLSGGIYSTQPIADEEEHLVFAEGKSAQIITANDEGYQAAYAGYYIVKEKAPAHSHAVSVGCETDSGDQVEFTAWDGRDMSGGDGQYGVYLNPGSYYLTDDVTINNPLKINSDTVDLCLNGHTINITGIVQVLGTLNICDCSQARNGKIKNTGNTDAVIADASGSKVNLYGGTVEGKYGLSANSTGAEVAIYGGTVKGSEYALRARDTNAVITLYGSPSLEGETADVYLNYATLHIGDTLAQPSAAYTVEPYSYTSPAQFTSGWKDHMSQVTDLSKYIVSANSGYDVAVDGGTGELTFSKTQSAHSHDGMTFTPWNGTDDVTYTGSTASLYLTKDVTRSDVGFSVPAGKSLHLCLNGFTVSGNIATGLFSVDKGGALTVCDCSENSTGKIHSGDGFGCVGVYNQGAFILKSGTVEGTAVGVYNGGNHYDCTINGGVVTGRSGIYNQGFGAYAKTFIKGGTITGSNEYGVQNDAAGTELYLSGAPSISGAKADIYTEANSSYIHADDSALPATPYSGKVLSLGYPSPLTSGNAVVRHATEATEDKFKLADQDYGLTLDKTNRILIITKSQVVTPPDATLAQWLAENELTVKDVFVTAANAGNILSGDPANDGKVKLELVNGRATLTLDNANIVYEDSWPKIIDLTVYSDNDQYLDIKVVGTVNLVSKPTESWGQGDGISGGSMGGTGGKAHFRIEGGTLNIKNDSSRPGTGLYTSGTLTVAGADTVVNIDSGTDEEWSRPILGKVEDLLKLEDGLAVTDPANGEMVYNYSTKDWYLSDGNRGTAHKLTVQKPGAQPGHTHAWASIWTTDETHHWHNCTATGCTVSANVDKDGYGAHTWNDGVVTKEPTATAEGVKTYTCTICAATKIEPVPIPTYNVSGTVTDGEDAAVSGATVKLMQGNTQFGETATTDAQGLFSFDGVKPGVYNIVATKDGVTMTKLVTVTNADLTNQTLTMPDGNVSSVLDVKPNTPDVVVGGLEQEAAANAAGTSAVTVTMTVETKEETDADTAPDIAKIKETASGKTLAFLAITVEKQVDDAEAEAIEETANLLTIVIPFDRTGKKDVTVYRCHGDAAEALTTNPNADGEYFTVSAAAVTVYAKKFSTYAIGYTAEATTPVTPSRPSSSSTTRRPTQTPWPFTDVKTTDSFYESVKYVYEKGWMLGTSDTSFSPDGDLTRAMLATVLYRMAGTPQTGTQPVTEPPFTDTQPDTWYSDAVAWAAQTQILRGYGNGCFGPDDLVSREMLNMVMGRLQGQDPTWTGDPSLSLPATRAEVAVMLQRFHGSNQ